MHPAPSLARGQTCSPWAVLISGNRHVVGNPFGDGVMIYGSLDTPQNNVVAGNILGLDRTGTVALPNRIGVSLPRQVRGNTGGGTTPGAPAT